MDVPFVTDYRCPNCQSRLSYFMRAKAFKCWQCEETVLATFDAVVHSWAQGIYRVSVCIIAVVLFVAGACLEHDDFYLIMWLLLGIIPSIALAAILSLPLLPIGRVVGRSIASKLFTGEMTPPARTVEYETSWFDAVVGNEPEEVADPKDPTGEKP